MRIISGSARGRRLRVGRHVRPTPDRVREALFDILAPEIAGCRFLDLYSGTGAVGLEALSRGAELAVLVERDPSHLRVLRENAVRCGLSGGAQVLALPVLGALDRLARRGESFDLVFADPPYEREGERRAALARLGRGDLLRTEARIILEHPARQPPAAAPGLEETRRARYGDTALAFYQAALPGR